MTETLQELTPQQEIAQAFETVWQTIEGLRMRTMQNYRANMDPIVAAFMVMLPRELMRLRDQVADLQVASGFKVEVPVPQPPKYSNVPQEVPEDPYAGDRCKRPLRELGKSQREAILAEQAATPAPPEAEPAPTAAEPEATPPSDAHLRLPDGTELRQGARYLLPNGSVVEAHPCALCQGVWEFHPVDAGPDDRFLVADGWSRLTWARRGSEGRLLVDDQYCPEGWTAEDIKEVVSTQAKRRRRRAAKG